MIRQSIYCKGWSINVYYNASNNDSYTILEDLLDIDCKGSDLQRVYDILDNMSNNQGFTFANTDKKMIVVVVSISDSRSELLNTIMHEFLHCSMFISKDIDDDPETPAYIMGELVKKSYDDIHELICDNCA